MIKLIVNSFKAAGVALAESLVLLLLLCAILGKPQDASGLIVPVTYAVLAVGAFICGWVSVKLNGSQGLLSGACSGAVFAFVLFIISLFMEDGEGGFGFWLKLLVYAIITIVSAIGGFIGIPKKSTAKIRKSIVSKYS